MENMVVDQSFWLNKRVFITGHTGFKGSWLSLWLKSMGAIVTGYALDAQTNPSLFDILNLRNHINHISGDIRDLAHISESVIDNKPEILIHLAAQSLVRESYTSPVETYSTNVMGTVNVLEAVRQSTSVKSCVIVTSDKCYENKEHLWGYRENEAMGGYDPYSNSKGCAELVTAAYRDSYFNPKSYAEHGKAVASARAGNVIGGGDWAKERLIPDILNALTANQSVMLRNPSAIRPWQHVLEPLGGYLLLAQKLYQEGVDFAEGWNFGPDEYDTKTVEWIAENLVKQWGNGASYGVQISTKNPHEASTLKLDCSKAHKRLQWYPQWNLETTVTRIYQWQKAFLGGENMYAHCLNEIQDYQQQVTDQNKHYKKGYQVG